MATNSTKGIQCRTGKGPLADWLDTIGKRDNSWCRTCGKDAKETGDHIVFDCPACREKRERAGEPHKWEDLDKEVMTEEEAGEKHDAVLDLFWSIGVNLERERVRQRRE